MPAHTTKWVANLQEKGSYLRTHLANRLSARLRQIVRSKGEKPWEQWLAFYLEWIFGARFSGPEDFLLNFVKKWSKMLWTILSILTHLWLVYMVYDLEFFTFGVWVFRSENSASDNDVIETSICIFKSHLSLQTFRVVNYPLFQSSFSSRRCKTMSHKRIGEPTFAVARKHKVNMNRMKKVRFNYPCHIHCLWSLFLLHHMLSTVCVTKETLDMTATCTFAVRLTDAAGPWS